MNIVLEGPDGAGKSTLAERLYVELGWQVVQGEGPPKSRAEFAERIDRYSRMDRVIFDRHPCISNPIYSQAMRRDSWMPDGAIASFTASNPFVIYVRPTHRFLPADHKKSDCEDEGHFNQLASQHELICRLYDEAMLTRANYICHRRDTHLIRLLHGNLLNG